MGAKTWMLVYADSNAREALGAKAQLEREATQRLARTLFPGEKLVPAGDGDEEADAYPFPFHPLDLGEAALAELFGYQLEGPIDASLLEPESIPLVRYRRSRSSWWQFWR